jgi:putative resolvase
MPFVKASVAREHFGCSSSTLQVWRKTERINCCRVGNGQWRFEIPEDCQSVVVPTDEKIGIIYARVSTHKQKEHLKTQIAYLQAKYPKHRVFQDVASGLNYKRPAFQKVLELCLDGKVHEVCVTHKDRLCRFSYDLVKFLLKRVDTKICVDAHEDESSSESDLADDIISIVTVFGARIHGARSGHAKRAAKAAKEAGATIGIDPIECGDE